LPSAVKRSETQGRKAKLLDAALSEDWRDNDSKKSTESADKDEQGRSIFTITYAHLLLFNYVI
jgi:hypothetical protein